MALRRRGDRGSSSIIWPGFVDAMTALLLVLMFVLSIFMIVQFILREELTGKDESLAALSVELGLLKGQLGERDKTISSLEGTLSDERAKSIELADALAASQLEGEELKGKLAERVSELAALTSAFKERGSKIESLEAIASALRTERDKATVALADLEKRSSRLEALEKERDKLSAETAEIRAALAAAKEEAKATKLTFEEKVAALELAVEKKRKEAEETLTLLAAAEAEKKRLGADAIEAAKKLDSREAALAFASAALKSEKEISTRGREALALLNSQVLALRKKITELSALLGEAESKDKAQQVEIKLLGQKLNQALARKLDEVSQYRSEFFGKLRKILGERDDVQIVGDRFVFRSSVLFESGSAELSDAGKAELARFASALRAIEPSIPKELKWVLRIDGHTDKVPLSDTSEFKSNWELSQARALSVVTYLTAEQSIAPNRLAAAGFGEYQPIAKGSAPEDLAKNRRIELRLDER
ncbi:MAG: peptidoglycan -binding protein [Neomegalonema sp.]|nr:peptidoglycan -binding protein [Neomegalonema sp.]